MESDQKAKGVRRPSKRWLSKRVNRCRQKGGCPEELIVLRVYDVHRLILALALCCVGLDELVLELAWIAVAVGAVRCGSSFAFLELIALTSPMHKIVDLQHQHQQDNHDQRTNNNNDGNC